MSNLWRPIDKSLTSELYQDLVPSFVESATNQFIFTVKTDNAGTSTNTQFAVPTIAGGTYDCIIDWGDGTPNEYINAYNDSGWTHTFAGGAGTYIVRIKGVFDGWKFNNGGDKEKLLNISQWGCFVMKANNMVQSFYGCVNLTITATDFPDASLVTSMYWTFRSCVSLTEVPNIDKANFALCNQWPATFFGAGSFSQDLSQLDITSNVDNLSFMLANTVTDFNFGTYWDWSSITNAFNFAVNTTMSTSNYDSALVGIAAQSVQSAVSLNAGFAQFTANAINVTSITRSGSTATVTTSSAHGLSSGAEIAIIGANQSEYNIPATISNVTPTTFDYTVSGTPTTPATGTISCYRDTAGVARQKLIINNSWTITDGGAA